MDKNSEIYKSKEYEDMFDAAETENMVNEEVVAYSQSLQKLRDIQIPIKILHWDEQSKSISQ